MKADAPWQRPAKTFLTAPSRLGGERRAHGYPDECRDLTSFADSLVGLAAGEQWSLQAPISSDRFAIVVDFMSQTERDATASLQHGWNGAWEVPMGATSSVYGRRETNEQNAYIERHLLILGTAMTQRDFHAAVTEKLLDVHSCREPGCEVCANRFERGLPEALAILASGTEQSAVHLFSTWQPSPQLRALLAQDGVELCHHDLDEIPAADRETNRTYSIWDGTPDQEHEFLKAIWAPTWSERSAVAVAGVDPPA